MDPTAGRGSEKNWETGIDTYTPLCIKQLMRTYCVAQGPPLNAVWWLKWEGNPEKRGGDIYMYVFMYVCIGDSEHT